MFQTIMLRQWTHETYVWVSHVQALNLMNEGFGFVG